VFPFGDVPFCSSAHLVAKVVGSSHVVSLRLGDKPKFVGPYWLGPPSPLLFLEYPGTSLEVFRAPVCSRSANNNRSRTTSDALAPLQSMAAAVSHRILRRGVAGVMRGAIYAVCTLSVRATPAESPPEGGVPDTTDPKASRGSAT
jgi:hypothetical protein